MKIRDIIRKIFRLKTLEEEFNEFVFSNAIRNMIYSGYDKIVQEEVDSEVKYTIENNRIGIDEKKLIRNINRRIFDAIDIKISEYESINKKKSCKFRSLLTTEYVDEHVTSIILAENSEFIVDAFQRFIDHNLEEVKKEDERLAQQLEDQVEDLGRISEDELNKASRYDNPNFDIYNDIEGRMGYDEQIIPPSDEESDIVSEDDESIEIIGEVPEDGQDE